MGIGCDRSKTKSTSSSSDETSESASTNQGSTERLRQNATETHQLFDGKSLDGWKAVNFGGPDEVEIEQESIYVPMGYPLSGVIYTGTDLPNGNYCLELEAKKVSGNDFFCCLTFPVRATFDSTASGSGESKTEYASFVIGGWGGGLTGVSCIDGVDASGNETKTVKRYDKDRWYAIKVQVTQDRLAAWIDDEMVVDVETAGKVFSLRTEVTKTEPLGLCCFETEAMWRNIRWTPLINKDQTP